jgi:hypothetical protein
MSNNVGTVLGSSLEDMGDELSSSVIHRYAEKVFKPLKDSIPDDGTITSDVLNGGITTLQYGLRNLAIFSVNTHIFEKLTSLGGAYLSYLSFGRVASNFKSKIRSRLSKAKSRGWRGKALQYFISDSRNEELSRVEKVKLAHRMSDTYHSELRSERTNMSRDKHHLTHLAQFSHDRDYNQRMAIYIRKTKTGTWTREDKKLYESVAGKLPVGTNFSRLSEKLNSYSEFAKTAEGQINNLAESLMDTLTTMHIEKPR